MNFEWTTERIEEVLRLQLEEGWTTYQLAAHFGVSRNSVCGKLFREKAKRGIATKLPFRPRTNPVPKTKAERKPSVSQAPDGFVLRVQPQKPVFVADEGQLASIVDVTGCRWAVRDDASFVGGHAFCNAPQDSNSPYCAHHRAVNVAKDSNRQIKKTISAAIHRYKKVA